MACCLVGTKPLSEPMMEYCQLDPWEQTSVEFQSKFIHFHSRKFIWESCLENGGHFLQSSMCWLNYKLKIDLQAFRALIWQSGLNHTSNADYPTIRYEATCWHTVTSSGTWVHSWLGWNLPLASIVSHWWTTPSPDEQVGGLLWPACVGPTP